MSGLEERRTLGRPIFGLAAEGFGKRWIAADGGPGDIRLAHGEPQPHTTSLITVGMLSTRTRGGYLEPHYNFSQWLLTAQAETMDANELSNAVESVPGPETWFPIEIEVDGTPRPFMRHERNGDWIAFSDIGDDELVWVMAEKTGDTHISLETVTEITPYTDEPA